MAGLFFSTLEVSRQCFLQTTQAFAIVNLKPIVPGHVLVIPKRVAGRLSDLNAGEIGDLFGTVQRVGQAIETAYKADGLTIACQDGKAAGQSVRHVHIHVIPRRFKGDRFSGEKNDDVYPAIEKSEHELGGTEPLHVDNEGRVARTVEEMEKEATWLRGLFTEK